MTNTDPPTRRSLPRMPRSPAPDAPSVPVVIREPAPEPEKSPVSRRIRENVGHWTPGGIAIAIGSIVGALGGPAVIAQLTSAWADQSAKLDRINASIDEGRAQTGCLIGQLQAQQAVVERNLRLTANLASELNGAPPNDSFPAGEIRPEKPLGGGPLKFPTRWEAPPTMPACLPERKKD